MSPVNEVIFLLPFQFGRLLFLSLPDCSGKAFGTVPAGVVTRTRQPGSFPAAVAFLGPGWSWASLWDKALARSGLCCPPRPISFSRQTSRPCWCIHFTERTQVPREVGPPSDGETAAEPESRAWPVSSRRARPAPAPAGGTKAHRWGLS